MKPTSLSDEELERILSDALSHFEISVSPTQLRQLAAHFSLLLKWREKISLTSLRDPKEIAVRHFAESLFLTRLLAPPEPGAGACIDVGSGSGFPGLPIAAAWPSSRWTLLEPNQKKVAFLKEAIRASGLNAEARALRLEDAIESGMEGTAALVTIRAVSVSPAMLEEMARLLVPGGSTALFAGSKQASEITQSNCFTWNIPSPLPGSEQRVVLIGRSIKR